MSGMLRPPLSTITGRKALAWLVADAWAAVKRLLGCRPKPALSPEQERLARLLSISLERVK